jgi:hypothetical protein
MPGDFGGDRLGLGDNPQVVAARWALVGASAFIPSVRRQVLPTQKGRALLAEAFGTLAQRGPTLALAAARLGAGLPASAVDLFVHERVQRGEDNSALDAWTAVLGGGLEPAAKDQLRKLLARTFNRPPPLR